MRPIYQMHGRPSGLSVVMLRATNLLPKIGEGGRSGGSDKLSIDFAYEGCFEAERSSLACFALINSKEIYKK